MGCDAVVDDRGTIYRLSARDMRLSGKGGVEDLRKAQHYLGKLIEVVEGDNGSQGIRQISC